MLIKCGACNVVVAYGPAKEALEDLKRHGKQFHPFIGEMSGEDQKRRFGVALGEPK